MKDQLIIEGDIAVELTVLKGLRLDRMRSIIEDPKRYWELTHNLKRRRSDAYLAYILTRSDEEVDDALESLELFDADYCPAATAEDVQVLVAQTVTQLSDRETTAFLRDAHHRAVLPAERRGGPGREFSVVAVESGVFVFRADRAQREN